ncbi:sensor histidine kinase [Brevibacterium limosum]|uniref:sensor histidine kinase n=1 Tax=Brevibacterium limosum TaxID=2697565 RepID=UPI001AA1BBDA|nr:HAMP domain-containing sensor histidine kinase [Brevibacterium limosum]
MTTMTDRRRGTSARTRILAWIMLVLTVAVFIIVTSTARAELAGVRSHAGAELEHEVTKFRDFAARPDPADDRPYTSVRDLMTSHLQNNLPEHTETFFSIVDGQEDQRSADTPPLRLDQDPDFIAVASETTTPRSGEMKTSVGPVAYAIVPVEIEGQPQRAQLVIIEFLASDLDEAWTTIWTMSSVAVVALVAAGFLGWIVAGRVLEPIRRLRETAAGIGEDELSRRIEVTGNDDVAQLGVTFNRMLDRLEAAFDGQRQLLDDAGHELRTPITVVRGQLQVMGDEPEDRQSTLDLVDDELQRMSRLVDDLVMLARSERPDFLDLANTDLMDLVISSFSKASALAPRNWIIDAAPEGFGLVDEERLTQALLQLASNAVDHTGPEDTIAFGGHLDGDTVRLWVRDTGAGIAVEDQERIFERFAKGRTARSGRKGTGLGLTIVDRIARAHGGTVSVKSDAGKGALFTLTLPWHGKEGDGR